MFGLGHTELLIILAICVLLFGASRIPQLGRGLGSGIRNFKDGLKGLDPDASLTSEMTPTNKAKNAS